MFDLCSTVDDLLHNINTRVRNGGVEAGDGVVLVVVSSKANRCSMQVLWYMPYYT